MFPLERGVLLEGKICKHTHHPEIHQKKSIKKISKDERIYKKLITIIIAKTYNNYSAKIIK